ncbi:hypothetical protein SAMN05444408_102344 [Chryseobacterium takakiae]|uniref:Uncharacterized protein n=1 Tax=Chryseobacterium takakiae TaxID=1302685 RepID=A0A1M4UXW7_9FLAO|nr:hypothetical protein SAMN05444408_102344 [Chryseobacterium takakiae]
MKPINIYDWNHKKPILLILKHLKLNYKNKTPQGS